MWQRYYIRTHPCSTLVRIWASLLLAISHLHLSIVPLRGCLRLAERLFFPFRPWHWDRPFFSRNSTSSNRPSRTAKCNGVKPFFCDFELIIAPALREAWLPPGVRPGGPTQRGLMIFSICGLKAGAGINQHVGYFEIVSACCQQAAGKRCC